MGTYLNPGNNGFKVISGSKYIDKTGLIRVINDTIDTNHMLTCVSRARRFGKSYAAQMLCAYYDKACDSSDLFSGLDIAKDGSFETYLNKYDVIYLDMTNIIEKVDSSGLIDFIKKSVSEEILR